MRNIFIYTTIVLLPILNADFVYAGAFSRPEKVKENVGKNYEEDLGAEKDVNEQIKVSSKLLYEKMLKRTKDCIDETDNLFFTVNSLVKKAQEAKDAKAYKELIIIASDYNSVLGDLRLMQVILDLGKFAEGEKFIKYCEAMKDGFEYLKGSFSFKNDLFLSRISSLKTEDALRYEKRLSNLYRSYFEYDPKLDRIEGVADVAKSEKKENKLKEKGR